jgi:hypothetical protein
MSPLRIAVAAGAVIVLGLLFGWQYRREQLVKACLDSGRVWNGPASTCQTPVRPILRRDLQRS